MNWLSLRNNRFKLKFKTAGKFIDHLRGIYGIYFTLIKEKRRMSTCNWLDLQTLESQPGMPKNLLDHWLVHIVWNICLKVGCLKHIYVVDLDLHRLLL